MSDFESKVLSSTAENTGEEYKATKDLLKRQAEAAKSQFGSIYDKGLRTPTDEGAELKADRAQASGEFANRQAAGTAKYDLSKAIDTRNTDLGNRVRAALAGRSNLGQDVAQQQYEQTRNYQQSMAEQKQSYDDQMNQLDFTKQKNSADRFDAMTKALEAGSLQDIMQKAAEQGSANMGDIDRYFQVLLNDFNNKMSDLKMMQDAEREKLISEFEATGARNSQMISAGVSILGQGVQALDFSKSTTKPTTSPTTSMASSSENYAPAVKDVAPVADTSQGSYVNYSNRASTPSNSLGVNVDVPQMQRDIPWSMQPSIRMPLEETAPTPIDYHIKDPNTGEWVNQSQYSNPSKLAPLPRLPTTIYEDRTQKTTPQGVSMGIQIPQDISAEYQPMYEPGFKWVQTTSGWKKVPEYTPKPTGSLVQDKITGKWSVQ